ncbi:MAG: alanine--tRNA ligase [Bdellovibrionota bacterium]
MSDRLEKITSDEIREKFLQYFESKDHLRIKNSSIIPKNDPTLLFINAGMAPMKKFFTGEEKPEHPRLCNVQSCIRTIDLDDVGDRSHLTSFLMLGSWSIGDYFKEGAIKLAYEFLTKHLNIPKEKLYVTVFKGNKELGLDVDSEAKKYWLEVGVPNEHIVECPMEDNFWMAGETGPCGPCTEVFYDTRDDDVNKYVVGGHFDTKTRYLEIWNAGVFMQYNRNLDGTYSPLKFKSIDTGAGLERLAMTLNGFSSVYDTDLLKPIVDKVNEISENKLSEKTVRILTDHIRTICLILSEKLAPSNEGRGYVPRKLIRRCILLTTKEGVKDFDYICLLNFVISKYSNIFPLFKENKSFLISHFEKEYEQFNKILISGLEKLDEIKAKGSSISKEDAFDLVTTYGLPFDIIEDYAKDNRLTVDKDGFEKKLEEHKDISKKQSLASTQSLNISSDALESFKETEFKGYEALEIKSNIVALLDDEKIIDEILDNKLDNKDDEDNNGNNNGNKYIIITKETPFYAEAGGQVADSGIIFTDDAKFIVNDVQKTKNGVFLHFVSKEKGGIKKGDVVTLSVNKEVRVKIANAHTAAHLLHKVLRDILGNDVHQAGSKVDSERVRFDFNCEDKISEETLLEIERKVNELIRENLDCSIAYKTLEEAQKEGAIALFETKYGNLVRVVSFGNVSKELCSGTHTSRTGNIGLFIILSVDGIGKGIRRISAITGAEAIQYVQNHKRLIGDISNKLKAKECTILQKIDALEEKAKSSKINAIKEIDVNSLTKIENASSANLLFLYQEKFEKLLKDKLSVIANNEKSIIVYLAGGELKQIMVISSKATEKDFKANEILKNILSKFGGKGNGNSFLASGGGIPVKEDELMEFLKEI